MVEPEGFVTRQLAAAADEPAPDGSEIRRLAAVRGGSMVHCTLAPGRVSRAVFHRTVEEIWYCVAGEGQVWRKLGGVDQVVDVRPGACLTIPPGTCFQFRNTGSGLLCIVIATLPPWPGADEAAETLGPWVPALD